jgi:hypothetical protein
VNKPFARWGGAGLRQRGPGYVEEFLLHGELAAADLAASLESLERCGRPVVDAFFAAADHLGARVLHHRAEEVA